MSIRGGVFMTKRHNFYRSKLFSTVAAAILIAGVSPAFAAEDADEADDQDRLMDEIVVTGRAGAGEMRKLEVSYSITTIDAESIREKAPMSTADILKAVPGFWVEASGGEANNNVRARGIPTDGYESIALFEDGLPIQHDPGTSWLNADQSFRLDETIGRIEVVRGGPSTIFASNAPGGYVNFITKKGTDTAESLVKLTAGDFGLFRIDGTYSGPLGNDLFIALGGFFREDDGVREPGFTANSGGQFRMTLSKTFERGRLDIGYKHLEDRTLFLLPIPLTQASDGDIVGIPGFDPNFDTMGGLDTAQVVVQRPDGLETKNVNNGTHVIVNATTLNFEYALTDEWSLTNKMRFRDSDVTRDAVFSRGSPESAQDRLDSALILAQTGNAFNPAFANVASVEFRYANDPDAIFDVANANGNGLVVEAQITSVQTPLREFINDLQLSRQFQMGEQTHDITVGVYYAGVHFDHARSTDLILLEVRGQPRLLDIVALDANGDQVGSITEDGFTQFSLWSRDGFTDSRTFAFYVADEWQVTDSLRIDAGVRFENTSLTGTGQESSGGNGGPRISFGDDMTFADDAVTQKFDIISYKHDYEDVGFSIGANYMINDDMSVFGRFTNTFRTPQSGAYIFDLSAATKPTQDIDLLEAGVKMSTNTVSLFATLFYTDFKNVGFRDTLDGVDKFANLETLGIELEGTWQPNEMFNFNIIGTFQDAEFNNFTGDDSIFNGKQAVRIPEVMISGAPGINLMDGRLWANIEWRYVGDRFADVINSVELPAFSEINAGIRFNITDELTLFFKGTNLGDEIGLTEGNPRSGELISTQAGDEFFMARPILGRAFRLSISLSF